MPRTKPSVASRRKRLRDRAAAVKLLVFDVDGVLTDGGLYYGSQGELLKRLDVKDGHGLVMARLANLPAAVLTARSSQIIEIRAKELGLAAVVQGRKDKAAALVEILQLLRVAPECCAYMGDDLNDLEPLDLVGLPSCPSDAVSEVKQRCLFISKRPGGGGAARELIELCLKASGRWTDVLELSSGVKIEPVGSS
jgi:3-deoxy-D-manno-octulosonate 8-phosphate phosphatase (KDO 8-P phosphatase)